MAVSREKIKALPAEALAELAATDELELLYLHVQSMSNFEALKDRFTVQQVTALAVPPAKPVPEAELEPVPEVVH